jgi:hypothetical protein
VKIRTCKTIILPVVLHIEEVHDLYSSPNVIRMIKSRRMGWVGHIARTGRRRRRRRRRRKVLVGHLWEIQRKEPLRRPRRRWVNNIEADLREIGWYGVGRIDLAQVWGQ